MRGLKAPSDQFALRFTLAAHSGVSEPVASWAGRAQIRFLDGAAVTPQHDMVERDFLRPVAADPATAIPTGDDPLALALTDPHTMIPAREIAAHHYSLST